MASYTPLQRAKYLYLGKLTSEQKRFAHLSAEWVETQVGLEDEVEKLRAQVDELKAQLSDAEDRARWGSDNGCF